MSEHKHVIKFDVKTYPCECGLEFSQELAETLVEAALRGSLPTVQLGIDLEFEKRRVAELEAENEKINYFFRRLRMFCIFAHWDNPNTEAEFYKVDAEIREYLSEYKVCIDQLTAHDAIERQDDKWIPEVQE